MKVVITGGNSYLGQTLARHYATQATEVVLLVRKPQLPKAGAEHSMERNIRSVPWDGESPGLWMQELNGADLLINMAGRSVNCRYTEKNKREIFDSRTRTTAVLGEAVRCCSAPPKVWLNAASATIYRHAEDRAMNEYQGEIGKGFSVEVCQLWEKTFFDQKTPGTRKVALRTAIVLGRWGGAYVPLRTMARLGLGGKQGSGRQMMSWIHETDFVRATEWIYRHPQLDGAINLAAPHPLPNALLMQKIRRALHMPFGLPSPKWLLEMGAVLIGTETELLLKSRWVVPTRLLESGFRFKAQTLDAALEILEH